MIFIKSKKSGQLYIADHKIVGGNDKGLVQLQIAILKEPILMQ